MNKKQRQWHIEQCEEIAQKVHGDRWEVELTKQTKEQAQLYSSSSVQPVETIRDLSDSDLREVYRQLEREYRRLENQEAEQKANQRWNENQRQQREMERERIERNKNI